MFKLIIRYFIPNVTCINRFTYKNTHPRAHDESYFISRVRQLGIPFRYYRVIVYMDQQ